MSTNDNERHEAAFVLKKIEIFSGHHDDTPHITRWFVNQHYTDGSESIVDDKLSYDEALASAVYGGMEGNIFNVPIEVVKAA